MKKFNPLKLLKKFIVQTSFTRWVEPPSPLDARSVSYKHYLRFDNIPLKLKGESSSNLQTLLRSRRSKRTFSLEQPDFHTLSTILESACGINREEADAPAFLRMYPSAGARYPLEIYLIVLAEGYLPKGIFHFNVLLNVLEVLDQRIDHEKVHAIFNHGFSNHPPIVLVITACPHRTISKYGFRGARYIFFEAGHISQNLYLLCEEAGLHCCAIGGFIDQGLTKLLYINPEEEVPIYALALG